MALPARKSELEGASLREIALQILRDAAGAISSRDIAQALIKHYPADVETFWGVQQESILTDQVQAWTKDHRREALHALHDETGLADEPPRLGTKMRERQQRSNAPLRDTIVQRFLSTPWSVRLEGRDVKLPARRLNRVHLRDIETRYQAQADRQLVIAAGIRKLAEQLPDDTTELGALPEKTLEPVVRAHF